MWHSVQIFFLNGLLLNVFHCHKSLHCSMYNHIQVEQNLSLLMVTFCTLNVSFVDFLMEKWGWRFCDRGPADHFSPSWSSHSSNSHYSPSFGNFSQAYIKFLHPRWITFFERQLTLLRMKQNNLSDCLVDKPNATLSNLYFSQIKLDFDYTHGFNRFDLVTILLHVRILLLSQSGNLI